MQSADNITKTARPKKKRGVKASERATIEDIFAQNGPLAAVMPGYEMRTEQVLVAEAVDLAMREGRPCVAEAGTGVGKSLAYLVPAVRAALNGKTTIISTHTISLQTQLMEKDIPLVLSLFPDAEQKVTYELMKGRGNFLCKASLENARNDIFMMEDPQFKKILRWARDEECTGDVADLPFNFSAWNELTSTPETCRGADCHFYNSCHYYRMRWAAAESNIIVVNHALFFSDLALRLSEPNSGILPDYHNVVFDEAHHLEDVATKTFGVEFGSRRLANLMDRIRHIKGLDIDRDRLKTLEDMSTSLFLPFYQAGRSEFFFEDALPDDSRVSAEEWTGKTCNAISTLQSDLVKMARENEELRDQIDGMAKLCGRAKDELSRLFFEKDENSIRWGEINFGGRAAKAEPRITLHLTPISIAKVVGEALWERMKQKQGSVSLISATLANSGGFSFLRSRLGVPDDAIECLVGSPFDFKHQAMLYVPGDMPDPPSPVTEPYLDRMLVEIERVLTLTEGRAFLLFTSRSALNAVYDRLNGKLPFPLFKQGDLPPGKLVDAFRASGNGCLLGVQTFWEGVDVQGEALSCVIIDKLPFAVPDSPITKARTKAISQAGGDWFRDYSIPQAQIRLKQGFGRLIRTRTDRGIVCILDSRLITRSYGAEFVRHLPPAARASKWPRVEKFWNQQPVTNTPPHNADNAVESTD